MSTYKRIYRCRNGKDGAADPKFETNGPNGEECLEIRGLKEQKTRDVDTQQSDVPEEGHMFVRVKVRLGNSTREKIAIQVLPSFFDPELDIDHSEAIYRIFMDGRKWKVRIWGKA